MMEVFLVSGFLGSGKTTLIRHLLTSRIEDLGKIALIVNEVGEIGVDGTLLSGQNVDMVEITSGCICCTMKNDFSKAVQEIRERIQPDFLIVEATGVAQPGDILDTLYEPPFSEYSRIRSLVTVVNADMFKARGVFGPFYKNQIRFADVLILNKVDLITPDSAREIETLLQEMNPTAQIFQTRYCLIEPYLLLREDSAHENGHDRVSPKQIHLDEWGFQTISFEDGRPMDRGQLTAFLEALPPTLFRIKGWVRFPETTALLDFTGGRYRIAPIEEPRKTALTFVGRNFSDMEIIKALKNCLINSAPT